MNISYNKLFVFTFATKTETNISRRILYSDRLQSSFPVMPHDIGITKIKLSRFIVIISPIVSSRSSSCSCRISGKSMQW